MCGIAGAVWTDNVTPLTESVLQRMTNTLSHRGPDDEGFLYCQDHAGGVALGHRRLSIIDLAGGKQPLANEDQSVFTVFNGEIYNFAELRRNLESQGHVFRTKSDTEVLVHLYEQEGEHFVKRLRGMFAFAIWDAKNRRLLIARDRMGQKPLVYSVQPGRLIFASEIKSLLEVPGVRRQLNPQALDQYLRYGWVPHPLSIYQGIVKLPPSHYAVFEDGRLRLERYWELDYSEDRKTSFAEYRERLRETLLEATRLQMISDVPIGAFLSGGIDSTIITALMQHESKSTVRAFSIGFSNSEFDETKYARDAANSLGVTHEVFQVTPSLTEILPRLAYHYDEPFADSSAIPTYYLSEITRKHVTVALTGDAADELFAGYHWYKTVRICEVLDKIPLPLRRLVGSRFVQRISTENTQRGRLRRLKVLAEMLAESPEQRYERQNRCFSDALCDALYSDSFRAQINGFEPAEQVMSVYRAAEGRDEVSRAGFADIARYLPCDILVKVDIASMAHGLECRSPFLDHHVVQLAVSMPIELRMRCLQGKRILRETFADLLPPSILKRGKMGFSLPLGAWLRGPLHDMVVDLLLDQTANQRGYFDTKVIQSLLDQHFSGAYDHSPRLWALVMLELWNRTWMSETHPITT